MNIFIRGISEPMELGQKKRGPYSDLYPIVQAPQGLEGYQTAELLHPTYRNYLTKMLIQGAGEQLIQRGIGIENAPPDDFPVILHPDPIEKVKPLMIKLSIAGQEV